MTSISIRLMNEADGARVAELWQQGLAQTSETSSWFWPIQWYTAYRMNQYATHAMSDDGDVGPKGSNLMKYWGDKKDRAMLVACLSDRVVGAVAVKKGMDYSKEENDSRVGSIWRMSVDETVRRQGLGKKLMASAEERAKKEYHCQSMGLWTANPVAARFYCEKCGYAPNKEYEMVWKDFFSLSPKIVLYEKSLE